MQTFSMLSESMIWQMPEIFMLKDKHSKYLAANKTTAHLFGMHSFEEVVGCDDFDMKCDAANWANQFIEEDQTVLTGKTLSILYLLRYADNKVYPLLAKKSPVFDPETNNASAVLCQAQSINTPFVQTLIKSLSRSENKYKGKQLKLGCYYLDKPQHQSIALTEKQSLCLFHLLRGKTIKEISSIVNKSPRTIESHMEQLKNKFACQNKSQLIEKAIDQGFLNCLPFGSALLSTTLSSSK